MDCFWHRAIGEPNPTLTTSTYPNATSPYPGVTATDDYLSAIKQSEYPVAGSPSIPNAYGTPADLWGRGAEAVDLRGTPMTPFMGTSTDTIDDPYELDLSRRVIRRSVSPSASSSLPADAPFTVAELERMLRAFDADASSLPDSLRQVVDPAGTNLPLLRRLITTDSFDLPSPAFVPTRSMILGPDGTPDVGVSTDGIYTVLGLTPGTPLTIVDVLRYRMGGAVSAATIAQLLPPELVAGQRLDLNRPFGNSRDDNNNGIVDEPLEAGNETYYWPSTGNVPTSFQSVLPSLSNGIDINNDTTINAIDAQLARHMYARHLYVLMMLLIDQGTNLDTDLDGLATPEETAQAIAQWAVNVVDFRDRDSIMTPFEYDVNPFRRVERGWNRQLIGRFRWHDAESCGVASGRRF